MESFHTGNANKDFANAQLEISRLIAIIEEEYGSSDGKKALMTLVNNLSDKFANGSIDSEIVIKTCKDISYELTSKKNNKSDVNLFSTKGISEIGKRYINKVVGDVDDKSLLELGQDLLSQFKNGKVIDNKINEAQKILDEFINN